MLNSQDKLFLVHFFNVFKLRTVLIALLQSHVHLFKRLLGSDGLNVKLKEFILNKIEKLSTLRSKNENILYFSTT